MATCIECPPASRMLHLAGCRWRLVSLSGIICSVVEPTHSCLLKAGCQCYERTPAAASELEHRESLEGRPHQRHSLASQAQVLSLAVQPWRCHLGLMLVQMQSAPALHVCAAHQGRSPTAALPHAHAQSAADRAAHGGHPALEQKVGGCAAVTEQAADLLGTSRGQCTPSLFVSLGSREIGCVQRHPVATVRHPHPSMPPPGDQEAERAGQRLLRGLISESVGHLKGSSTGRSAAALAGRLPEAAQTQRLHGGVLDGGLALHLFVICVMFVCGHGPMFVTSYPVRDGRRDASEGLQGGRLLRH